MNAPRLSPEVAAVRALDAESYEDGVLTAARDLRARADYRRQLCAEDPEARRVVVLSLEYAELLGAMLEHAVAELHRLNSRWEDRAE